MNELTREKCFGCGLCVATCPAGAIGMEKREMVTGNRPGEPVKKT